MDILARDKSAIRRPDVFGMLPKVLSIHQPWILPIPDSQDFNQMGSKATIAAEVGIAITNSAFTLADGNVGVLRSFTVYITDMLASTDVTYSLFVNGGPAPGFGSIKMFPRVASSLSNSFDCVLHLPVAAKLEVFYTNTDGGSYIVGASYSGWQHPESSARRWVARGE
jgi:hypothetical protein